MGMSASQARLLSLTSKLHDLEYSAQALQYTKFDLVASKQDIYDEYLDVLDSTKYQMSVLTYNGNEFQDISYINMVSSSAGNLHSMYIITNTKSGQVYLPEQITSKIGDNTREKDPLKEAVSLYKADGSEKTVDEQLSEYLVSVAKTRVYKDGTDKSGNRLSTDADYLNALRNDGAYSYWSSRFFGEMPSEEDFMMVVAKDFLYSSRIDISEDADYISQMKKDGNYDYWKEVYSQITGYEDENGNPVRGRGFCTISRENAVDRGWLEETLNSGDTQLFKLTKQSSLLGKGKVNIFESTGLAEDPDLVEVKNEELIAQAEVKYEKAVKDIEVRESKLDLQLSRLDAEHTALKTEYDSVKQIVSKNIDRSFKSFNA